MRRTDFDNYLSCFNERDYDGVTRHFVEDAVISFADVSLHGHDAIRAFYAFFHAYVDEQILVDSFLSDDQTVMMEATVRLTGIKDLTAEKAAENGYPSIVPLKEGQVIELPQFIHYHLEQGKFRSARCAMAIFKP